MGNDSSANSGSLSKKDLGALRRGRARALQALYAWDLRSDEQLEKIAVCVWDDLEVLPNERRYANQFIGEVATRLEKIDAAIAELTTNWRLERIGVIERCVLRLGSAELLSHASPPKVAIQEAVRLAERFGTAESARFVNGVLDAFARKINAL
jgi:N utilization substance protein B